MWWDFLLSVSARCDRWPKGLLVWVRIRLGSEEVGDMELLLKAALRILGRLDIHESEKDHKVQSIFKQSSLLISVGETFEKSMARSSFSMQGHVFWGVKVIGL